MRHPLDDLLGFGVHRFGGRPFADLIESPLHQIAEHAFQHLDIHQMLRL